MSPTERALSRGWVRASDDYGPGWYTGPAKDADLVCWASREPFHGPWVVRQPGPERLLSAADEGAALTAALALWVGVGGGA